MNEPSENKPVLSVVTNRVTTTDGETIAFDSYVTNQERAVIIAPGFYNSKAALLLQDLARDLSALKYDVILMDFRGHGESTGLFHWTSKEYLDLLAVVEYAATRWSRLGLIGFSLGAATSLITAPKTKAVKSVVAISAPTEFEKIEYHFWELSLDHDIQYSLLSDGRVGKGVRPGPFWLAKERPIDTVKKMHQPVFYIHGTEDWLIKPWHSEMLMSQTAAQKKRLEVIPNAPHAEYIMRTHRELLVERIDRWFGETL